MNLNDYANYELDKVKEELNISDEDLEYDKSKPKKLEFLSDNEIVLEINKVKNFLYNNINSIYNTGHPLKDFEHYCFEYLLEMFYGKNIWNWYKKYNKGE